MFKTDLLLCLLVPFSPIFHNLKEISWSYLMYPGAIWRLSKISLSGAILNLIFDPRHNLNKFFVTKNHSQTYLLLLGVYKQWAFPVPQGPIFLVVLYSLSFMFFNWQVPVWTHLCLIILCDTYLLTTNTHSKPLLSILCP